MDRQPARRSFDATHLAIDVADLLRSFQGAADVSVHFSAGVHLAHPVVAVGGDPELLKGVDEEAREVAGVRGVAVVRRVRDVRERHAKGAFHRVTTQHGLSVHGIEVVDPVQD